jgi:hypothetical protein
MVGNTCTKNVGGEGRGRIQQSAGQIGNEVGGMLNLLKPNPQEDKDVGYTPPEDNGKAAPIKLAQLGLPPGPAGNTVNVFHKEGIG